mmetsp:Transcript_5700/g.13620  ORF Transcript_5700/g.13620 Transcript_5700/m.13620 type:complete len:233 (+) Transcript_5700:1681-2379(+)
MVESSRRFSSLVRRDPTSEWELLSTSKATARRKWDRKLFPSNVTFVDGSSERITSKLTPSVGRLLRGSRSGTHRSTSKLLPRREPRRHPRKGRRERNARRRQEKRLNSRHRKPWKPVLHEKRPNVRPESLKKRQKKKDANEKREKRLKRERKKKWKPLRSSRKESKRRLRNTRRKSRAKKRSLMTTTGCGMLRSTASRKNARRSNENATLSWRESRRKKPRLLLSLNCPIRT